MTIDIMTLFPENMNAFLHESILGRAVKKGIVEINCHQIRDYTENKQKQVDDYPYGGGWGCVMMAQPLKSCLDNIMSTNRSESSRVIYMSPQGEKFTEETAKRLANNYDHLVLVCGHYEGIDERFIEKCVDEEVSIGDFVLTGGEIAAMAVTDSVCRLIPGVLSDEECYTGESHWDGLLEYPQYTRPEIWEGIKVPDVLIDGNKAKVDSWRYKQQLIRTRDKRPDMFEKLNISDKEKKAIEHHIKGNVSSRIATIEDLSSVLKIIEFSKKLLKSRKIDQWQGEYPSKNNIKSDIDNNRMYVLEVDGNIEAFFVVSFENEKSYDTITDGKWSSDMPYAVLHRAAVSENYLGTGLSDIIFKETEKIVSDKEYKYIRTDTHKKNKSMQRCFRDAGYQYRGNIDIGLTEPGHDSFRYGFEKRLKSKK